MSPQTCSSRESPLGVGCVSCCGELGRGSFTLSEVGADGARLTERALFIQRLN